MDLARRRLDTCTWAWSKYNPTMGDRKRARIDLTTTTRTADDDIKMPIDRFCCLLMSPLFYVVSWSIPIFDGFVI